MKQNQKWKPVSRAALFRAFSGPGRTHEQVKAIVAQYMGNGTVPPQWSLLSVRGILGKRIAREWARHIRHLPPAVEHDAVNGTAVTRYVQSAYDLGTTPEALREPASLAVVEQVTHAPHPLLFVDEFHLMGAAAREAA